MRQYLGSHLLQRKVAAFWPSVGPVGAICHGVVLLARTTDLSTGHSVLADRRTTCLPKYMERSAYLPPPGGWAATTAPTPPTSRTRCATTWSTRSVRAGPPTLRRGTATDDSPAFVVEDGTYLSARWPGDAYLFARRFEALLTGPRPR